MSLFSLRAVGKDISSFHTPLGCNQSLASEPGLFTYSIQIFCLEDCGEPKDLDTE
jgi:hypothetical protein